MLPIPLFVLGAYAARSLVNSKLTDLGGMEFARDSSVLWLENLVVPDPYLAICSGLLGITAFRTSAAVRAEITYKTKYLTSAENHFFNPKLDERVRWSIDIPTR